MPVSYVDGYQRRSASAASIDRRLYSWLQTLFFVSVYTITKCVPCYPPIFRSPHAFNPKPNNISGIVLFSLFSTPSLVNIYHPPISLSCHFFFSYDCAPALAITFRIRIASCPLALLPSRAAYVYFVRCLSVCFYFRIQQKLPRTKHYFFLSVLFDPTRKYGTEWLSVGNNASLLNIHRLGRT